jgi:hypothetical protein
MLTRPRRFRVAKHSGLILAMLAPGSLAGQEVDLTQIISFRVASTPTSLPLSGTARDVRIDENITIDWNEATLGEALGRELGIIAPGDPLGERINLLRYLTDQFLDSQTSLLEFLETASALESARLEGGSVAMFEAARDEASSRFSAVAGAGLDTIMSGRMESVFGSAQVEALLTAADSAVFGDNYTLLSSAMGEFLEPELRQLADELAARIGEGRTIRVYMSAWLSGTGATRRLHLDQYDDIATGEPSPFPRFQIAIAERTKRELESAKQLQAVVENPGRLKAQIETAVRALQEEVNLLTEALRTDVIRAELTRLERELRNRGVEPLRAQVREALSLVETLSTPPEAGPEDDMAILMGIVDRFDGQVQSFLASLSAARTVLPNLAQTLRDQAGELPEVIQAGTITALDEAGRALRERPEIQQIAQRASDLAETLGLTRNVLEGGQSATETARVVDPNIPLDTFLDLLTVGERHPGDRVDIQTRIMVESQDGTETTLAQGRQTIRLRFPGVRLETRGALLFANPTSGGFDNISFEPVIGVSYLAHYGRMGHAFWNDFLNPGLGMTLSLHHFDPDRDFELGVGGVFSLFQDLLFVGYGRNLQAEANYFFVGVNPLALGDLWGGPGAEPRVGRP